MLRASSNKSSQFQIVSLEEPDPQDHLLRKIENAMDWSFIYDLVKDIYSQDKGRPSMAAGDADQNITATILVRNLQYAADHPRN